jgi:peroxiredoxin Q/BCP
MKEGDKVPQVTLQGMDGQPLPLKKLLDKPLVLYFYPKDDTSGCTSEALAFTERAAAFAKAGVRVVGVSKDPPAKHAKFIDKHGLKVELATDADGSVLEAFGTWIEKSMYGRKYMGIERATFLIGRDGRVARVWHKVKVPGHAAEVLEAAQVLA